MIHEVIKANPQLTGVKQPFESGISIFLPPKIEKQSQQKIAIW
jgi:phage tail protein X